MGIDEMKDALKESQEDGMKKNIDIDALRREIEIANGQLSDYKAAHSEMEKKYSANIASYKELENKYNEMQRKSDHYNASLIDKNIHLQRLLEQNEELKGEYDTFQKEAAAKMSNLGTEINKLQNEITEKNKIYNKDSKEWKRKHAEITESHQKEMKDKNECIVSIKQKMVNEVNNLKAKLSENVSILEQKLKKLHEKIEELQKDKIELLEKYEIEKCKLHEKEQTLHLLQAQLSRFSLNKQSDKQIESQMNEVFETFNNEKQKLSKENQRLLDEKSSLKSKLMNVSKENKAAKEGFERHKKNMCQQLERAHAGIQLRQERSERLIKTFEQRLELRQKQNVDYREKIDELSATLTSRNAHIAKLGAEVTEIGQKLKRYQHSVSNAQSLNETLLKEKQEFDAKMEERDDEIKEITKKHNKLAMDINQYKKEREAAIKTSVRMRSAEEKAYNEMMEYKSKYNELEERTQRKLKEMENIKKQNENLNVENTKLAGHHNAQQRINHLLNLKKECEKLKKEKKLHLNKISALQKKLKSSTNMMTNLDISSISNTSSNIREEKMNNQNLKSPVIQNRIKQRKKKERSTEIKNNQRAKTTTNKKDNSDSFTFE